MNTTLFFFKHISNRFRKKGGSQFALLSSLSCFHKITPQIFEQVNSYLYVLFQISDYISTIR